MTREKKLNIARALTAQLHATEEAIDTALNEAAHLIEIYISSRRAINMSTIIGTQTHAHTLEAMRALNTAQIHMGAAHESLVSIQTQVGLGAHAMGPSDKPERGGPEDKPLIQPTNQALTV